MPDSGHRPYDDSPENRDAYRTAREVLSAARAEAFSAYKAESSKRIRIVAGLALACVVITAVLVLAVNPELLLAGEIALGAVVVVGVFYLLPSIMGKGELEEVFRQYEDQVERIERSGVAFPPCSNVEELVAAIDFASAQMDAADQNAQ